VCVHEEQRARRDRLSLSLSSLFHLARVYFMRVSRPICKRCALHCLNLYEVTRGNKAQFAASVHEFIPRVAASHPRNSQGNLDRPARSPDRNCDQDDAMRMIDSRYASLLSASRLIATCCLKRATDSSSLSLSLSLSRRRECIFRDKQAARPSAILLSTKFLSSSHTTV